MKTLRNVLVGATAIVGIGPALALNDTIGVTTGTGKTANLIKFGSNNVISEAGVCDATTENQCAAVSAGGALKVDGSAATQPISAASLPLPTGAATAAGLTTINTTLGSPFQAGGSIGNTSFAATQATAASLNATVVGTGTFATQAAQSGTWNITNVSGTVSLPTGAATSALQPTNAAQASTTSGQTGPLVQCAATTGSPTYTTAQTDPLSCDTAGNIRTLATQATAANLNATVVGTGTFATQSTLAAETTKVIGTTRTLGNAGAITDFAGQNASSPANSWLMGGQFNTTPTTLTSGNASPFQLDNSGKLLVNCTGCSSSGSITSWAGGTLGAMANYGTSPGAVLVPGVNAFVTNALTSVNDNSDAVAVATPYGSPIVNHNYAFNGTSWDRMQDDANKNLKVSPQATAAGGATLTRSIASATPTGINIKASAGTLYGAYGTTIQSTPVYLKLYNASSAPTCGSGTPFATIMLPSAATAANGAGNNIPIPAVGVAMGTGIGYCVTGGLADNDTTAITAANTIVHIVWN